MKILMALPVFLLMMSVGMSLRPSEMGANWKRLNFSIWVRLMLATFIIPPAFILLLHRLTPLRGPEALGLFMVAVAPGAPLVTRNIARRGFDMHLAASYQIWGALLTPIMIPVIVYLTGRLYDKDIWISPVLLIEQIGLKQFVPVLVGVACTRFLSKHSEKIAAVLNMVGNATLVLVILLVLVKVAPTLAGLNVWAPIASLLLAVVCIGSIMLLLRLDLATDRTLAICNANRFVGLALLLAGQSLHRPDAVPAIACYALIIAVATIVYPRYFPALKSSSAAGTAL